VYNKKISTGSSSYLPKTVGVGALGVVPAFEGQGGISTGYPYHVGSQFFKFFDTVPVSIAPIREMSVRHGRYGLCFTRCVFVWDGGALETDGVLDFCSPAPHGGFFYVPSDPIQYKMQGGLLYAFGEAKDHMERGLAVSTCEDSPVEAPAAALMTPAQVATDHRVCVVCLSEQATMATNPCGHRCFCSGCSPAVLQNGEGATCPVCRASITSMIRVY